MSSTTPLPPTIKHDEPTIMVFGDIFLDHSLYGNVHKIANESPTPVLQASTETYTLGGAGNVMMNLRALGANVISMCPVGLNDTGKMVRKILYHNGIQDFGIDSPRVHTLWLRHKVHRCLCRNHT